MKKIKIFMFVALFGAIGFGAFSAHDYVTMSANEKALLENIEALTSGEIIISGEKCSYRSGTHYCAKRSSYRKWVAKYCIDIDCD